MNFYVRTLEQGYIDLEPENVAIYATKQKFNHI